MKALTLNQIETIEAGQAGCVPCGAAVILGAQIGGIFGGWGALIGAGLVALGPNCLDLGNTGNCSE